MDIRLARPFGSTGYPGDFRNPESDDMAEHHCLALRPGDSVEAPLPCRCVWGLRVVTTGILRLLNERWATGAVPEVVSPDVQRDGPHPRLELELTDPVGCVAGEGAICAYESFLAQVLRLVAVPGHPAQAPIETARHVLHQAWKSGVQIAGKVAD